MDQDDILALLSGLEEQAPQEESGAEALPRGRLIEGAEDGMQDTVPAVVLDEDGEPTEAAKLSAGEFVIPAWAVSALGNGNTEAGMSQLSKLLGLLKEKYPENIAQESAVPFEEIDLAALGG